MELWVRSQNKETLAKVTDLYVEEGKSFNDIYDGYDISNNTYRFGRYKTIERAKEVLNDIQHKMISLSDSMNRQLYVYEMPEEKDNASSK